MRWSSRKQSSPLLTEADREFLRRNLNIAGVEEKVPPPPKVKKARPVKQPSAFVQGWRYFHEELGYARALGTTPSNTGPGNAPNPLKRFAVDAQGTVFCQN